MLSDDFVSLSLGLSVFLHWGKVISSVFHWICQCFYIEEKWFSLSFIGSVSVFTSRKTGFVSLSLGLWVFLHRGKVILSVFHWVCECFYLEEKWFCLSFWVLRRWFLSVLRFCAPGPPWGGLQHPQIPQMLYSTAMRPCRQHLLMSFPSLGCNKPLQLRWFF